MSDEYHMMEIDHEIEKPTLYGVAISQLSSCVYSCPCDPSVCMCYQTELL